MTILNMTWTGEPCPDAVQSLKYRLLMRSGDSLFQFVEVHCLDLATVLDRLEYLERFEKDTLAMLERIKDIPKNPNG